MKYLTVIGATLLVSCSTTEPLPKPFKMDCPPVAMCTDKEYSILNNEDLAMAFVDTKQELRMCKIAKETLEQCINNNNSIIEGDKNVSR